MAETLSGLGNLLRAGALATASHPPYRRAWRQRQMWCEFMGYSPWLPEAITSASTTQLGAFAVYFWRFGMNKRARGNTHSTILSKLSVVRWYHRFTLGCDPGLDARHALLLREIRRFSNPVLKQHPVTVGILRRIRLARDLRLPDHQLLWGGLLLAYFFLFRRSEYAYIGRNHHDYIIKLRDIKLLDGDGTTCRPRAARQVAITLRGAKNNQFGREEARYQHASRDPVLCPVKAARWILKGARTMGTLPDQPALRIRGKFGVSSAQISRVIKMAARAEGHDSARFSTYSIRIGGATKLLNAGADRLVIKLLGRWLSNTFEEYPVLSSEEPAGLSDLMC